LAGAVCWTDAWCCRDPGGLVAAYARLFTSRGGRVVVADADTLRRDGSGWSAGGETAERAVVALGPWSPGVLRRFGYRIPMVRKRGYHLHYRGEHGLRRPMALADHSVVLSPVTMGLRICTAAELSSSRPAAHPPQLARGEQAARSLLDLGDSVEDRAWSGTRPCLPRMLPLVCEAPRHPGLWFHFGHGHQGFTLGPVTADRMARAMTGEPSAIAGLGV
jgi:D-amino-acid dehydrogenase